MRAEVGCDLFRGQIPLGGGTNGPRRRRAGDGVVMPAVVDAAAAAAVTAAARVPFVVSFSGHYGRGRRRIAPIC